MLRPFTQPREVTIDLPPLLVESLGVGAEVLANYLTKLAEAAANEPDPTKHPAPEPVLCRICERQITPWWFEKHSDLCLQEHRSEMDVQIAQENLNEHRHAIVKVLDALEARQSQTITGDSDPAFAAAAAALTPQPEYKGLPIGPASPAASAPSSGAVSGSNSAPATPPRSREHSASNAGHSRGRSFAVRRPLARIVELVLDLCDTALEINMPIIKESRAETPDDFRTLSPQSESRISQVVQWQSPSTNTLEQEQGLAALSTDTEQVCKAKIDAVIRHRKIVEYAERIRIEYTVLVEECITAALSKAERIAAGQLSDSSCSEDEEARPEEEETQAAPATDPNREPPPAAATAAPAPPPPSPSPPQLQPMSPHPTTTSALTMSIRNSPDTFQLPQHTEGKNSSSAVSTGPSTPMECPTPRSYKSNAGLSTSQPSRRALSLVDTDTSEASDSSAFSSAFPGAVRTESPSSERSLERKRKSLVLPGLANSPKRQPSPARTTGPRSPLRMPKPRLSSSGADSLPSPMASPSTNASELAYHHSHLHHHHLHHRRQSSATSSDAAKAPVSPRMTQHQPRPAPPSIKDFEIIKPISKGAFGSVYLSKKKTTGEYFAIKVLKKADMIAKNQTTNVKAERAIMMCQGESDFVAKLYWTFSSKDYLYLVMEYLNGGDCASLVKVLGGLSEDWAKQYIAEVVLGVENLHSRGIVHRDLKPDNLLIDQTGHLKLTDFGLSRMGLVGRQKRLLKSLNDNELAPDPLKQDSYPRATSLTSSRSASFDFQGPGHSPGSTPLITPEVSSSMTQPSYFSLNQSGFSRQSSRRESGYRSDSVGSDHLNSMFRAFSLNEGSDLTSPAPNPTRSSSTLAEDETQSDTSESPYLYPLQPTASNQTSYGTPPQQIMIPPLMALFDPEDNNRRFVGTPDYLAPETINGLGQDEISDWWSLGCIMFEFLFGYPPFNASTPDEVFDNILHRRINWPDQDDIDELATPESVDLMNKLMTSNPRERLGANVDEKFSNGGAEIRSHPWFSDVNWNTLLEDKAQFVPNVENPEDTEYFDARGAQAFADEQDDGASPQQPMTTGTYPDRPHDALFKVRSQVNSVKRPVVPLSIPPHVRDSRSRRLSEPVAIDDFGSFSFKNLPMLEKANKDVIQKLRQEALQAQQRQSASGGQAQPQGQGQNQGPAPAPAPAPPTQQQSEAPQPAPPPPQAAPQSPSAPSLEGSPLPMPLQRAMSHSKGHRPSSPSNMSQANSSPSRPSQPSSPLLVQFSTGQNNHERRKTSGSSSANSHQSSGSFPVVNTDQSRMPGAKLPSTGSSPVKTTRAATHSPDKTPSGPRQSRASTRARSQTVGSQDGELSSSLAKESYAAGHSKRRSQLLDVSPSSSDNEDPRTKALLKVQRRRQSSRRLSQINLLEGPFFRPLDVLICEDHPVSRIVMERLFEKLRCRTITARNGAEATSYALSEVQFDIVMTEFKLPQVNGADFARMVRETRSANRHTPIIAVTGYLKDLPETHHFDSLIEKPPTLTKLTEALCEFCQWKPPPKDYNPSQPVPVPPGPRHIPLQAEDSPSSTTSSSFAHIPPSSYRGSSREDSISSSCFGDMESVKADDIPVIVSRQADEWSQSQGGLGISDDGSTASGSKSGSNTTPFPPLPSAPSAPDTMNPSGTLTPRKQRSSEAIRAKRESLEKKRYECAESGDDEDEELGNAQTRTRSPQSRSNRPGSKLGIEMMRTNSRGSVVSGSEEILQKERETLRRQSRGSDEVCEIEESLNHKELEDDLDKLRISESTGEEISPGHSPDPNESGSTLDTTSVGTESRRPSLFEQNSQFQSPSTRSRSTTLIKGHITPPVVFPQQEDELSAAMVEPDTPTIKTSAPEDSMDMMESETTPRPTHTPTLNPDSEPTPRKPY